MPPRSPLDVRRYSDQSFCKPRQSLLALVRSQRSSFPPRRSECRTAEVHGFPTLKKDRSNTVQTSVRLYQNGFRNLKESECGSFYKCLFDALERLLLSQRLHRRACDPCMYLASATHRRSLRSLSRRFFSLHRLMKAIRFLGWPSNVSP